MADDLLAELEAGVTAPDPAPKTEQPKPKPKTELPKPPKAEKKADNSTGPVKLLKSKIRSYRENKRFGKYLADSGYDFKKALAMKSEDQLKDELVAIDNLLARKSNNDLFDMMARGGLMSLELAAEKSRFKLHGLAAQCYEDEHWSFCLERAKMKHGLGSLLPQVDPALELMMLTYLAAMQVHKANVVKSLSAPVSNELLNEVLGPTGTKTKEPQAAPQGPQPAPTPAPPTAERPSNVGPATPAAEQSIVITL